eukprot:GHVU01184580.1.p1 GENE.GHVU01184580.1~~GHVU01184580.1.p1  ORF type:complete len:822 (-),score=108.07 GHVU01184580.1:22-2307(-)
MDSREDGTTAEEESDVPPPSDNQSVPGSSRMSLWRRIRRVGGHRAPLPPVDVAQSIPAAETRSVDEALGGPLYGRFVAWASGSGSKDDEEEEQATVRGQSGEASNSCPSYPDRVDASAQNEGGSSYADNAVVSSVCEDASDAKEGVVDESQSKFQFGGWLASLGDVQSNVIESFSSFFSRAQTPQLTHEQCETSVRHKHSRHFHSLFSKGRHHRKRSVPEPGMDVGFSFSPAGLLLPYHLGVVHVLKHTAYITEETSLAGASAGALAVATAASGLAMDEVFKGISRLAADARAHGTVRRLHSLLGRELEHMMPAEAHETLNGRVAPVIISYTQVLPVFKGHFVSHFESKRDLIQCLNASCNVPFYFSHWPTVSCRGHQSIDGFFAVKRKHFGCPKTEASRTVSVTPFSASLVRLAHYKGNCISPDLQDHDESELSESMPEMLKLYEECALRDWSWASFSKSHSYSAAVDAAEGNTNTPPMSTSRTGSSSGRMSSRRTHYTPRVFARPRRNHRRSHANNSGVDGGTLETSAPDMQRHEQQDAGWETDRQQNGDNEAGAAGSRRGSESQQVAPPRQDEKCVSKEQPDAPSSDCQASTEATRATGVADKPAAEVPPAAPTGLPKMGFNVQQLLKLALEASPDDNLQVLFDIGRADAVRWLFLEERYGMRKVRPVSMTGVSSDDHLGPSGSAGLGGDAAEESRPVPTAAAVEPEPPTGGDSDVAAADEIPAASEEAAKQEKEEKEEKEKEEEKEEEKEKEKEEKV